MTGAGFEVGTDTLDPAAVAIASRTPGVRGVVPAGLDDVMAASVAARDALVASGTPVYGVTTGFGDRNISRVEPADAAALQAGLIRYHLAGTGPAAPDDVVRATLLIRANCLARGRSGIRPEVVRLLLDCLAADLLPVVPVRGSVGASGDLVPLCYVASMLVGEGTVRVHGVERPAAAALAGAGLRPVRLEPKEALALINGTAFLSAFAVHAYAEAADLCVAGAAATALAVEALRGNRDHFHPMTHANKPHPGQVHVAGAVRRLLDGSGFARGQREIAELNGDGGSRLAHPIQDRYSVRCAPHVLGVLHDTLGWAGRWLAVEINASTDNPLFEPGTGEVHNGGNFYGGHVGMAMDSLKVAVASAGDLLDRQLALVVDEKYSNGLPAGLTGPAKGPQHGFKGVQIATSALVAEALQRSAPATVHSRSTEAHNQDKVSMATIAARDACAVTELVREATAAHLAALCQAIDLRGGPAALGEGTRAVYTFVRDRAGFLDRDRRLDHELAGLAAALRSGALTGVVAPFGAAEPRVAGSA
ncbi:aromatic amino acid ammonia-lyase [Amycolatopsis sp. DG1A-15b]|uniref:HAL/PAL/TAL family ammonia-lyase n=1 Tax=Amycolatopsis sp. DG1A-15b TaxID=3052846 RepID=UPI00255BD35A|nr:aromatic amino acid ammonia-lyase [Amycolatopsis sp. DG1A-15b]WIX91438.1 aromatic amino acid ammonia-lyase [Amycolatopsis sp. DG1A-15b]